MELIWSPLAIERMTEIKDYISKDSQQAAVAWVESIFDKVENVKQFPYIGRIVPEANKACFNRLP